MIVDDDEIIKKRFYERKRSGESESHFSRKNKDEILKMPGNFRKYIILVQCLISLPYKLVEYK
jgi:hypothetical protein